MVARDLLGGFRVALPEEKGERDMNVVARMEALSDCVDPFVMVRGCPCVVCAVRGAVFEAWLTGEWCALPRYCRQQGCAAHTTPAQALAMTPLSRVAAGPLRVTSVPARWLGVPSLPSLPPPPLPQSRLDFHAPCAEALLKALSRFYKLLAGVTKLVRLPTCVYVFVLLGQPAALLPAVFVACTAHAQPVVRVPAAAEGCAL
jgi:hypothetical protein